MVIEGEKAMPFMKASYLAKFRIPALPLPPEILEMVYMYCLCGAMQMSKMRKLYPAAALLGMDGMTGREILHGAVEEGLQAIL